MHIGIIGLGYVGKPLATAFADADFLVTGFDIDEAKIKSLRTEMETAVTTTDGGTRQAAPPVYTSDPTRLRDCDVIITTVPTPITEDASPDLSHVRAAGQTIGEQLTPETIAVLESTVYPGATRSEFVPAIEGGSGFTLGEEFDVGYSPERINPGSEQSLRNTVKPVAATTADARRQLAEVYNAVTDEIYLAPSIEAAEAAKCLENAQRDVDLALTNQFAMACDGIDGLEYEDVLAVADSKWNFRQYSPGLVEGHCIPVDPYFLIDILERNGESASLLQEARAVNESMVNHILSLVLEAFTEREDRVDREDRTDETGDRRLLVYGLAYKPNTGDVRSTAKRRLFEGLRKAGIEPVGYDPHVEPHAVAETFDVELCASVEMADADGVLLLTDHDEFLGVTIEDLVEPLSGSPVVVDTIGRLRESDRSDVVYRRL